MDWERGRKRESGIEGREKKREIEKEGGIWRKSERGREIKREIRVEEKGER